MPNWLAAILQYLVPPVLAALLSGFMVLRWKGKEEYVEDRFEELCELISETANLATEYWSRPQSDPQSILIEAKILAGLTKIAGVRVMIRQDVSQSSTDELEVAETGFFREATGGDFGVHNREADKDRAARSQLSAARFVVAVRHARLRDLRGFRRRK